MEVIFLAYANSQNEPLPSLKREDDRVYSTLVHKALGGHFLIHRDSFATIKSINEHLGDFTDSLAIFLYSGHAGKDSLLLDDQQANSNGIALQLRKSASEGVLKLVILNGCATAGQVKKLLEAGVPTIIATNAKVEDESATEFAIRFFKNIAEKHMTIKEAFNDSLGPAQLATKTPLEADPARPARQIDFLDDEPDEKPLWELFAKNPSNADINPLPKRTYRHDTISTPNEKLVERLYKTLYEAKAPMIVILKNSEDQQINIDEWRKHQEIINCLPFPIAVHLQKLLSPVEEENEGYDKINVQRLEQIGLLFHITLEFLTFIMIAQLWDLTIKCSTIHLNPLLATRLKDFIMMKEADRTYADHIAIIREIREYFDSIEPKSGATYFIEELPILKNLYYTSDFKDVCQYLGDLRKEIKFSKIAATDLPELCETAEEKLCDFFGHLGFLHHYRLTSIQQIDILKFRHTVNAEFRHKMVKLMQIMEYNYYLMPNFMDNMGIILLKQQVKVKDAKRKIFEAENLDWLNLSPFLIDKNAFEEKADLSNLMIFKQIIDEPVRQYEFKKVTHPDSADHTFKFSTQEQFEVIRLQFESFLGILEKSLAQKEISGT